MSSRFLNLSHFTELYYKNMYYDEKMSQITLENRTFNIVINNYKNISSYFVFQIFKILYIMNRKIKNN